jgi:hypothetical protein
MGLSRDQLHEIGDTKLRKYDEWIEENPDKLSIRQLKEAVEWWRNEIKEDYNRLEEIPKNYDATYLAGFNNITLTSILFGIVERYYIKKLENIIANKVKNKNSNKTGKKATL